MDATMHGQIYFVGIFPGDGDLLSAAAIKALRDAEVVLHDAEIPQSVLDLTPPWTQVRNVGSSEAGPGLTQDKIHALLIAAAREGHQVVRLKSGGSPVTETASDELAALEHAGVHFEVVSTAIGAAAGAR